MSNLLRTTLVANAAFSAACAIALTLAAPTLGDTLGLPVWVLFRSGIALGGFAALVATTAAYSWIPGARAVLAADVAWVAGAAVVVIGFGDTLTVSGTWVLIAVTIVVLDLAIVEGIGLRTTAAIRS